MNIAAPMSRSVGGRRSTTISSAERPVENE
jgi:hypothetical protein